jgi:hypothetical protein
MADRHYALVLSADSYNRRSRILDRMLALFEG